VKLDIVAFTARGAALAEKLLELYPSSCAVAPQNYCNGQLQPLSYLHDWTHARFQTGRTLVFIGAAGIAVRAIAPFVSNKASDAAVICIDEGGENIIPLLSGHIGGANRVARELAKELGGRAIITTATDLSGVFAVDDWAARSNCVVANVSVIKDISAALLDGKTVGLRSDFPITGELPRGVCDDPAAYYGVELALLGTAPFPCTLHVMPRIIVAGIGCRRGIAPDVLKARLREALKLASLPIEAVGIVASIDIKAGELGLHTLCDSINAKFITFTAEELMSVQGEFEKSERVLNATGADNVCQRAVSCAGARLITGKIAGEGVTVALGILDWEVRF